MKNLIKVGKIVNTMGLKGNLKILLYCQKEIFLKIKLFFISDFEEKFFVEHSTFNGKVAILKMTNYNDATSVEKFKNHEIMIEEQDVKLENNQYFIRDIIGTKIVDKNSKKIGIVKSVENYGAGDILVFDMGNIEKRVPFVVDYFEKIDIENKILLISSIFFEGVVWKLIF